MSRATTTPSAGQRRRARMRFPHQKRAEVAPQPPKTPNCHDRPRRNANATSVATDNFQTEK